MKTNSHVQQIESTGGVSYDAVSIIFHWITAFLVIAIFGLALSPGIVPGSIALHNTLGFLLLGTATALGAGWLTRRRQKG